MGFSGDGGPGTSASVNQPSGLALYGSSLYFADYGNDRVRQLNTITGIITTVAGNGARGWSGDGGPGTSASLREPRGVTVGAGGHLFIADGGNHRVRRLNMATGIISTVAGNGADGFGGDGGPATSATLSWPTAVAFDVRGNMYIAEFRNHRIRLLNATTGIMSTFAGNGYLGYGGDGGPATSASFNHPAELLVRRDGSLLIVDHHGSRVRVVDLSTRIIITIAGNGDCWFSGDGGPATSAGLCNPHGVAIDQGGNLFIGDHSNLRVRFINATTGTITTVAGNGADPVGGNNGDGGPGTSASISAPGGVLLDGDGNLYIADMYGHRIRMLVGPAQCTPTPSPSPSTTPYCHPSLFRVLPRMDLVGTLVGSALSPGDSVTLPAVAACRQACCDAAACDGYSFETTAAKRTGSGDCFLYVNITQLIPSSVVSSGIYRSAL